MILDTYTASRDLREASMDKNNTRSKVFTLRADAPEFKPGFSPQPNGDAAKSCWKNPPFGSTEIALEPQIGQFHPQAKSCKLNCSSDFCNNAFEDYNGAQQIDNAENASRVLGHNTKFVGASTSVKIYINTVKAIRQAALARHATCAHPLVANTYDRSEQPAHTFGCSPEKLEKRVNTRDFSFEPPAQYHTRYLQAQAMLCSVTTLKPLPDIVALLDQSVPATAFHLFSWLPREVRQKIFLLIQPGPRVVELRYSNKIAHPASPSPVPVVFSICRESRQEAQKRYIMLFRDHWLIPRIWIDPDTDTLYLGKEGKYGYGYVSRPYGVSDREVHAHDFANYFKNMLKNLQPVVWASLKKFGVHEPTYTKNAEYLKFYSLGCVRPKRSDISVLTRFEKLENIAIVQDPRTFLEHTGPITLIQTTKHFCKECQKLSWERGGVKMHMEKKTCKTCYRRITLLNKLAMGWAERPRHNDTLRNEIISLLNSQWHPRYQFMIATRLDPGKFCLDY